MVSNLTVKWNDNATESKKLERIMVQKWIALFPDGQEAWSEMRRTGYPGIVTISSNRSGGEVPEGELISRLKFPTTEYSDNGENTQAAVSVSYTHLHGLMQMQPILKNSFLFVRVMMHSYG